MRTSASRINDKVKFGHSDPGGDHDDDGGGGGGGSCSGQQPPRLELHLDKSFRFLV